MLAARRLIAALVAVSTVSITAAQAAGPLLAHRAVYDIALVSEKSKTITAAGGRIAFEFSGNACDGYVLNFRQVTTLDDDEGRSRVMDMRSSTWEGPDGKSFRFTLKNFVNNAPTQASDGTAERAGDGGVSIRLSEPRATRLDLPGEPVFPTEHTRRLLDAAMAGQRTLQLPLYDGSDGGEKFFDTTSVIGRVVEGGDDRLEEAVSKAGLAGQKRWPVSVSYFEGGASGDRTPIYIMSFDLLESGVYSNIKFDFGDFALAARISTLDKLSTDTCQK
ncbi:MAG TPA: cell envelope integrity EipB family protein [Beijerinckiaceae bacterium]|nr:cell envelope integrity EipB family protein [Beijerinckiaceae bacterium]